MGDRRTIQKRIERARWFGSNKQREEALAKAAEHYGLDPKNSVHREMLLLVLADVLFGSPGKKGRPKGTRTTWGNETLLDLGWIYEKTKRQNPKLSAAKIAELIHSEHKEFQNIDVEQIRQKLPEARREWLQERYPFYFYDYPLEAEDREPEDYEPGDYDD
jgi:hypothetical protein